MKCANCKSGMSELEIIPMSVDPPYIQVTCRKCSHGCAYNGDQEEFTVLRDELKRREKESQEKAEIERRKLKAATRTETVDDQSPKETA